MKPSFFNASDEFKFIYIIEQVNISFDQNDIQSVQCLIEEYILQKNAKESIPLSILLKYAPEKIIERLEIISRELSTESSVLVEKNLPDDPLTEEQENLLADIGELQIIFDYTSRRAPNLGTNIEDIFNKDEIGHITTLVEKVKEKHPHYQYNKQAL